METVYLHDFQKLVDRNKYHRSDFRYYVSNGGFRNTFSICDFSLPDRSTHTETGYSQDDWYRDSFVCNVGLLDGSIPLRNNKSIWNYDTRKWEKWPHRGAMRTMEILVAHNCVQDTREVREFLKSGWIAR